MFDQQFGANFFGPTLYNQYRPASQFLTVMGQGGGGSLPATDPNDIDAAEEVADVEWAHAMAPGAKIDVIECSSAGLNDLTSGAVTAANLPGVGNQLGVSVVSMSWGAPEGSNPNVPQSEENSDDPDFETPSGHVGVTFVTGSGDHGAPGIYPAFSPTVVSVGGTSLSLNGDSSYNSETGWSGSGGGPSLYEAEPTYQYGVQVTGQRTTPDVAFLGNVNTGPVIYDSFGGNMANPWNVFGGTSFGTPCWAGIMAIVNQGRVAEGKPTFNSTVNGAANPAQILQALYSMPAYDFHKITGGNNGATTVGLNDPSNYNEVTGLGSPRADWLIPDLVAYTDEYQYTWTGKGSDALWSDANNWVDGVVPPAGADLLFPKAAQQTATIDDLGFSFNSITVQGSYSISGSALTVTGSFVVRQGTLTIDNATTISGFLTIDEGGTLVVNSDGTLDDQNTITVSDDSWLDVQGSLTVEASALLDIAGTVAVDAPNTGGGAGNLNNLGTITVESGGNLENIGTLNDQNTIVVGANGALADGAQGVTSGTMTVAPNATLDTYGTVIVSNSATLDDQSTITVEAGGVLAIFATVTVETNGTLNGDGVVQLIAGGILDDKGTVTIASGGYLEDEKTVTVESNATLDDQGTIILQGNSNLNLNGTTTIEGQLNLTGNAIVDDINGSFSVSAGATVDDNGNGTIDVEYGTTMSLEGTVTVESKGYLDVKGAITIAVGAILDDRNSVFVDVHGTLDDLGTVTVESGATLDNDNTITVESGALLDVLGLLRVRNVAALLDHGTVKIDAGVNGAAAGWLDIAGTFRIKSGGKLLNLGKVTVENAALLCDQDAITVDPGATIDVIGTLTEGTNGNLDVAGIVTIEQNALLDDQSAVVIEGAGAMTDDGSVTVELNDTMWVYGSLSVPADGLLDIYGSVSVEPTFQPVGTVTLEASGSLSTLLVPTVTVTDDGGIYNGSPYPGTATVNSSSTLEGVSPILTYTSRATDLTLSGAPTSVGTYTVVASFPGSQDYGSVQSTPVNFSITEGQAVVSLKDNGGSYNGSPFAATATVNGVSNLEGVSPTLTYYLGSNATGTPLSGAPVAVGTYTVLAFFPGSTDYSSDKAQVTFTIGQATPVLTWNNPSDITYGTALSGNQLNATATILVNGSTVPVLGNFTYTPAPGTVLNAGNDQTLSEHFVPTDTTDYSTPTDQTVSINVNKAGTTTTASAANVFFSSASQSVTFSASVASTSGLGSVDEGTVTFSVFNAAGTTQIGSSVPSSTVAAGSASAVFSLPGNTALGAYQIHALYNPGSDFTGSSDNIKTLTVSSPNATTQPTEVTTSYSTSAQTLTLIGNVTSTIGPVNGGTFTFTVAGFGPVTSGTVTNGTASATFTLPARTAPQTIAITTAYSGSGSFPASTNSTGALTVTKAMPLITWKNPADITYGTKLSSTQLNAAASVAGTFAYTSPVGTVLNAGNNQTLTVTFTPTDTTHYSSTSTSVAINVLKATLTVTTANKSKTYGNTFTAFTGSLSGLKNGDNISIGSYSSAGSAGTATVAGGPYGISANLSDPSSKLGNYNVVTNDGALTVNKAPLTITANNQTKSYGQTFLFAGTELTTSGLMNSDAVTSVTLTSTGAAATATVAGSPYTIVASAAVGTGLANYTVTYKVGHLTVSKATPTFSNLTSPAIIHGNNVSATISGHVAANTTNAIGSVVIKITGNGVKLTKKVSLEANGSFSTVFTHNWTGGSYTVSYHYAGTSNFNAITPDGSTILVVS